MEIENPKQPILRATGLTRRFGDLVAVDRLSLEVQPGELFGLVGMNGAGKSTLIRMLITLLPPSEGHATVCGLDIVKQAVLVRQSIGYVPQMLSADGELTAFENLKLYARIYDVPRGQRHERITQALAFMDLLEGANKRVREFSGGMVRRLEIAQAMLHRPRMLFLDEPTIGLDPVARTSVWNYIRTLKEQHQTTVLMTSHMLDEVETLSDRIGIMSAGELAATGTVDELKRSVGGPNTPMEEVFVQYAHGSREPLGGYGQVRVARKTARRLG